MGLSKTQFVKHSSIYVILGFLPLGINVLLAPVYSYYLSPADYGIIGLAQLFIGVLSVFIGGGIHQSYARFYFEVNASPSEKSSLLRTAVLLICVISIALFPLLWLWGDSLFAFVFQNNEFRFSNYGYIVFFTAFAGIIIGLFQSFYRNEEKPFRYSVVSIAYSLLSILGILLGVVYFKAGAMGNILGRSIGAFLVVLILVLLVLFMRKAPLLLKQVKPMFRFGLPLIPYALMLMLFNGMDKWMVERFFDLSTLGYYNLAFVLASSASVFLYAIYNAVSPRILKVLTSSKDKFTRDKEVREVLNLFGLGMLLFLCLALIATPLFVNFLIAEEYRVILSFLGILFIIYLLQLYYVIYTIPFYFEKKSKMLPLISFLSLAVGSLAYYFSIDALGFKGVFLGLITLKFSQVIITLFVLKISGIKDIDYLKVARLNKATFFSLFSVLSYFLLAYLKLYDYNLAYYFSSATVLCFILFFYRSSIPSLVKKLQEFRSS